MHGFRKVNRSCLFMLLKHHFNVGLEHWARAAFLECYFVSVDSTFSVCVGNLKLRPYKSGSHCAFTLCGSARDAVHVVRVALSGNPDPLESGIQDSGTRNFALEIRNTAKDWHPESEFHWQETWNPVPGIRNPHRGIQNPRLSWITALILLHKKFLQFDWLRAVVFQLYLKYPLVKSTNPSLVVV